MRSLLTQTLATGLALAIVGSGVSAVALRTGIAPDFEQRITLDSRHILVIRNGPQPTCVATPNPPRSDCASAGPQGREFSVYYLMPQGFRSLVWFPLP